MKGAPGSLLRNKRVFVTGHTGFTGVWLCHWLLGLGAEVSGYALSPVDAQPLNLFDQSGLAARIRSVIADIRDYPTLAAAMADAAPDVVFHLAAQPIVKLAYSDPEGTYSTNVMGTLAVLRAANAAGVKALVNITSDKAYENREWVWGYRENDRIGGHDMYSSSKGCADLLARSFWLSFCQKPGALRIATARAGNIIGGGDWAPNRLVPDIARAYEGGEAVIIRRPGAVRPWQHVLEAVRGYIMLADALLEDRLNGEAMNFGPQPENIVPVRELADIMTEEMTSVPIEIRPESSVEHEGNLLRLDITKARAELGWSPVLTFKETVQMTAAFYRRLIEAPNDAQEMIEGDIERYRSMFAG